MIYDIWNYNGEPIADARIQYLAPAIGKFVVVEGLYTFSGKKKDRLFVEDAAFRARPDVEIVVVKDYVPGGAWANETHQRNAGGEAFLKLSQTGDLGIFSDADELPAIDFTDAAKAYFHSGGSALWYEQDFFYYNFGWRKKSPWPPHGFCATRPTVPLSIQKLRTSGQKAFCRSGWHASYFETPARIADKIRSFSHTELNIPRFTDETMIRARLRDGKDLFDRPGEDCDSASLILPSVLLEFNARLVAEQERT